MGPVALARTTLLRLIRCPVAPDSARLLVTCTEHPATKAVRNFVFQRAPAHGHCCFRAVPMFTDLFSVRETWPFLLIVMHNRP